MAEIDDTELERLRTAQRVLDQLANSPKTSKTTHESLKVLYPEHKIPIDPDDVRKEIKTEAQNVLDEHLKKEKSSKLQVEFQNKLNSYRQSPSNPDGYTDEGIEKIVELMHERSIPDVDAAVLLFAKLNPSKVDPPSGYVPTNWNFGARTDANSKLLFEDTDAWFDQEARKVLDEHRKNNSS